MKKRVIKKKKTIRAKRNSPHRKALKKTIVRTGKKTVKRNQPSKKILKKTRQKIRKKTLEKKSLTRRISKQKKERIETGISNFDSLIEGGFNKNATNLLVGSTGSGKSIFATQFLIGGMKRGEKCLYVTFEESKKEFYENMANFGWNLADYEKRGLFTFLEYTPMKVKTMLEEGGGSIESLIIKKKISRMVIDSITSFALLFDNELEKREAALALFNMIANWNCTSLLTFEGTPLKDEKVASRTLVFESDAIILLYFIREKQKRQRYLEILKMRGTAHSKGIHKLSITKKGIQIEKRDVRNLKI